MSDTRWNAQSRTHRTTPSDAEACRRAGTLTKFGACGRERVAAPVRVRHPRHGSGALARRHHQAWTGSDVETAVEPGEARRRRAASRVAAILSLFR
jgi:hypothetical protein